MSLPSYALPSYMLPSRALPSRALLLIREYSRPMTKPNWRDSKPIISTYRLYLQVNNIKLANTISMGRLYQIIFYNISNTEWYYVYVYISYHGLCEYLERGGCNIHMPYADGIQEAIQYNISRRFRSRRGFH